MSLEDQIAASLVPCECTACWCREVAPYTLKLKQADAPAVCKDCARDKHDRPRPKNPYLEVNIS